MRKKAQSLVEYGLIIGLIAVICVPILNKFYVALSNTDNRANTEVNNTNSMSSYCTKIGLTYNPATKTCP